MENVLVKCNKTDTTSINFKEEGLMKKRILALCLVMALVGLCIAGCSCSKSSSNTQQQVKQDENVRLVESGYEISEGGYMNAGVVIENPSQDTAYEFPKIIATAFDANGAVLATETQVLNEIQPGERQAFHVFMSCNGQEPARIDFSVENGNKVAPSSKVIKSSDLIISGTNERVDKYSSSLTGMVKNNSQNNAKGIAVTVLLRKEGKIVSAYTSFVDDLNAGQEKPFDISLRSKAEHDSYEVVAIDWM